MAASKKRIIGTNALVTIKGVGTPIHAKVDTGADGTAIWASNIFLDDNYQLHFTFFDKQSPLYSGEEQVYSDYEVVKVYGTTGEGQLRFRVKLPVSIKGKKVRVWCSLTDRSARKYPMLIGKRTLYGKFIVDVSKSDIPLEKKKLKNYHKEFTQDPKAFLKKYEDIIITSEI